MWSPGGPSAERLGPLDPSLVLPIAYALSRPLLAAALESDPSVFPAALAAAAALRRFERSVLRSLADAPLPEANDRATHVLRWLVAGALQLAGAAVLWVMAEWGARLGWPHVMAWWAAATLQSFAGIVAATATTLVFALPPRAPSEDKGSNFLSRAIGALSVAVQARRSAAAASAAAAEYADSPADARDATDTTPVRQRFQSVAASPLMSPQKLLDGGGDRHDVVVYNERFGEPAYTYRYAYGRVSYIVIHINT